MEVPMIIIIQEDSLETDKNLYNQIQTLISNTTSLFSTSCLSPEKLRSEAQTGFINALNSYSPALKVKFTTYAHVCMQRQILSVKIVEKLGLSNEINYNIGVSI
jgi:DNA-directed RNA polymerase specialized sigma subunit